MHEKLERRRRELLNMHLVCIRRLRLVQIVGKGKLVLEK